MKLRIKIPLVIIIIYLAIVLLATFHFFQCNGVQFSAFHGKCGFSFIVVPSITDYLYVILWDFDPDTWIKWPVWLKHLETFLPFLIDLILYYLAGFGLGVLVEKILKGRGKSDIA